MLLAHLQAGRPNLSLGTCHLAAGTAHPYAEPASLDRGIADRNFLVPHGKRNGRSGVSVPTQQTSAEKQKRAAFRLRV